MDVIFVVGVFCGPSKPSSAAAFLQDTVDELMTFSTPVSIHGKMIKIQLQAVLADAPARCFLKCIKYFTGYHGCDRCMQEGEYDGSRIIFPETDAVKRTDENFRSKNDEEHHRGVSPFESVSFDMVRGFPNDY